MSLAEKVVLVRLRRSWWRGNVTDFTISDEVTTAKNASKDAGVFVKKIMRNDYFSACTAAFRAVDTYHKKMTVPWNDRAERALPADKYFEYAEKMRELMGKVESAVADFVGNLGDLIQNEHARLGDAFSFEDYPSADQLRSKYNIDLKFTPLQNLDDIRIAIPEEEKAKIRQDCEEMFAEKLGDITTDLWHRLHGSITRMVENLQKNDRIHGTMITNICELVQMLPSLNVANDPQLAYMAREIDDTICRYRVDDIRDSVELREQACDDAQKALDKIDSIIGGWK